MSADHTLTRDEVDTWLHLSSPRVRFLKTLPYGASVLDLGAGDGSLALFKNWLTPHRPDIQLYGVSLADGPYTAMYDGWENKNFEVDEPFRGQLFDAVHRDSFRVLENGPET